jgi:hypothetical protein
MIVLGDHGRIDQGFSMEDVSGRDCTVARILCVNALRWIFCRVALKMSSTVWFLTALSDEMTHVFRGGGSLLFKMAELVR